MLRVTGQARTGMNARHMNMHVTTAHNTGNHSINWQACTGMNVTHEHAWPSPHVAAAATGPFTRECVCMCMAFHCCISNPATKKSKRENTRHTLQH